MPDKDEVTMVWSSLAPEVQARLNDVLTVQLPEVFSLNRIIEQKTGFRSQICRNMLVDALSHLSVLGQSATDLSEDEQKSQLAKIEEHLRRAIIEHPEEVVRDRIAEIADLWPKYEREAYPYRDRGVLTGAPRHAELEELKARIDLLLEAARAKKPAETTWDESLDAAAEMTEAADLTRELANKLEQSIGEAQRLQREEARDKRSNWQFAIGILAAAIIALGAGFLFGRASDNEGDAPPPQNSSGAPARER